MKTQTYTKINTIFNRYKNLKKVEVPNKAWLAFQNKIIEGEYCESWVPYLANCKWDCYSKIDGTNSKIVYFPSTGECFCGGKTDSAEIVGTGQKPFLDAIIERIKPILAELFPPESAKFAPKVNDSNQISAGKYVDGMGYADINGTFTDSGKYIVETEEVPVYIYGEFFGKKIQKGGNYDKDNNRFSIFDICQQGWYVPIDMLHAYAERLGLDVAPYIGQLTLPEIEEMVRKGFPTRVPGASNPNYPEEGIVARPVVPIKDPRGKRIIIKVKSCDFNELDAAIEKVGRDEYEKFRKWYFENREEIEKD